MTCLKNATLLILHDVLVYKKNLLVVVYDIVIVITRYLRPRESMVSLQVVLTVTTVSCRKSYFRWQSHTSRCRSLTSWRKHEGSYFICLAPFYT